ncbi:hypothetical protein dsx2_2637 [Desulfovibrio sp. X2]|uniref:hypothetical protein n=1 Tax=Desulfovibrio sp. X2 TaxID=941449 RepID=UPI000358B088|nr:hypothetical protein [Desulfovibrio sp. X2]EPR42720.1 hypothetical protein dsx2_2637 [Desulfovibrio sp. X2]
MSTTVEKRCTCGVCREVWTTSEAMNRLRCPRCGQTKDIKVVIREPLGLSGATAADWSFKHG